MKSPISEKKILNVIFDLQFESKLKGEFLLADIVDNLKKEIGGDFDIVETPLLTLPDNIRKLDPNLKYQPIYEILLKNKSLKVLIGTYSIGINFIQYENWEKNKYFIDLLLKIILTPKFDIKPIRTGLRYVNFYEGKNIIKMNTVNIKVGQKILEDQKIHLKVEKKKNNKELDNSIGIIYIIDNNNIINGQVGSVLDIISFIKVENKEEIEHEYLIKSLNYLHKEIESIFKDIMNAKK